MYLKSVLINHVVIVSLLLWAISSAFMFLYKPKNTRDNSEIFECGFRPCMTQNTHFHFKTGLLASFILLYDFEFFLLYPYITAPVELSSNSFWLGLKVIVFLALIYFTLYWDLKYKSIFLS